MGAKTALLAFSDGDPRPALLGATRCDPAEAAELVRAVMPGYAVTPLGADGNLSEDAHPGHELAYATVLAGTEIVADSRLALLAPSEMPAHLLHLAAGRRMLLHVMHSATDALTFAVWEDGALVRALSLSPDGGVVADIGVPYAFERPYRAGERPVEPVPGWSDEPYPLPFHPLELGEDALRALFGFTIEGRPAPDDIDAFGVHLHGFRVEDPTGRERATWDAAVARWTADARRVTYRPGPDGVWTES